MASVPVLVSLPIHKHFMVPWNDMRRGDCCGRFNLSLVATIAKSAIFSSTRYVATGLRIYPTPITLPSHSSAASSHGIIAIYVEGILDRCYCCEICDFDVCLYCAKYPPPPEVIDISETHPHKLTLSRSGQSLSVMPNVESVVMGFLQM
ncbi:unnamed protein product [Microthlaspi erraticum]|uniref:Uncharacterized protein n=1 Tax=Microthlaspi erraticum TaxID=1685480 RepID=A0A6D2J9Z2_9BRAS|nr:unnamed protein product [Microthlaspi erraticum]